MMIKEKDMQDVMFVLVIIALSLVLLFVIGCISVYFLGIAVTSIKSILTSMSEFFELTVNALKKVSTFIFDALPDYQAPLTPEFAFASAAPEKPVQRKVTLDRIKAHEQLYARLWKTKIDLSSDDDINASEILCLPAPKMIVENNSSSKVSKDDIDLTKYMKPQSSDNADISFDEMHDLLLAQSLEQSNEPPIFDTEILPEDTVINTTVSKDDKQQKEGRVQKEKSFSEFREEVAKETHQRWLDIFASYIGSEESSTWSRKRNTTCPECGRDKKFFLVDSDSGATHCATSSCDFHARDGFATIAAHTGEKYGKVVRKIAEDLGLVNATGTKLSQKKEFKKAPPARTTMTKSEERYFKMIMLKSKKLTKKSLSRKYLISRGIPSSVIDNTYQLAEMDSLSYIDEDGNKGRYPCLVSPISKDNELIGFHRIYLTSEGKKLGFEETKKPTGNFPGAYSGARIQLGGAQMDDGVYRIAEGVETALAVTAMFGKPCWSTMTAVGIQTFIPPEGCKKVIIYSDLDLSKTGEIVAAKLAERLQTLNIQIESKMPPAEFWNKQINPKGIDWLDVYNIKQKKKETC